MLFKAQIQVHSLSSCVLVPIIDQPRVNNLVDDIMFGIMYNMAFFYVFASRFVYFIWQAALGPVASYSFFGKYLFSV